VSNMRTRKAKRHKWLKSNTRGTELLEISWLNQRKTYIICTICNCRQTTSQCTYMQTIFHTRRIFHSNLYLFLQHTVHLDLYKTSLECHLLLALRVTVAFQVRQGSERVWIQWHYSHQQNLHCHEGESKQFTETSDHYRLHFKMNDKCVKQNIQNCFVFHEYTKQNILD
jgi:hypothetical protein